MEAQWGDTTWNLEDAHSFASKFMGLMGRTHLDSSHGLFLENCSSVHMFFMKFPLDIIYLAEDSTVLYVETLRPWCVGSLIKNCKHVVEVPAGEAQTMWSCSSSQFPFVINRA